MLASGRPYAKTFRLAFDLASGTECSGNLGQRATSFIDRFFHSEVDRVNRKPRLKIAVAADVALTVLLSSGELGTNLILACILGVHRVENDLDTLIDDGYIALRGAFDTVARRRSALELLRGRLATLLSDSNDEEAVYVTQPGLSFRAVDVTQSCQTQPRLFSEACCKLAEATHALDTTIESYVIEGYELLEKALVKHSG
jgi:hypothetical protein